MIKKDDFLEILGIRRIVVLTVLLAVNLLLAAGIYFYIMPQTETANRQMSSLRSKENTLRNDIANLQTEFNELESQQGEFKKLQEGGFFERQSGSVAESIFLNAEKFSKVSDPDVFVDKTETKQDPLISETKQVISEREISIKVGGIDDIAIYKYLDFINQQFPGHLETTEVSLKRTSNVNEVILRAIAGGADPSLVEGQVSLVWRTMVPEVESPFGRTESQDGG